MLCVGAGFGAMVTRFGVTVVVRCRTVACDVVSVVAGRRTRALRTEALRREVAEEVDFGAGAAAAAGAGAVVTAAAELPTPLPATMLTMAPAPTSEPTLATAVITRTLRRARSRPSMLRRRWGVMSPLSALPG